MRHRVHQCNAGFRFGWKQHIRTDTQTCSNIGLVCVTSQMLTLKTEQLHFFKKTSRKNLCLRIYISISGEAQQVNIKTKEQEKKEQDLQEP